jgi:hypothetical protein
MNTRLLELAERRGALRMRIAAQREALAHHVAPLETAFAVADQGMEGVRWLKGHPAVVGGALAVLTVLRPRRVWRWLQRGLFVWRGWRGVKKSLFGSR